MSDLTGIFSEDSISFLTPSLNTRARAEGNLVPSAFHLTMGRIPIEFFLNASDVLKPVDFSYFSESTHEDLVTKEISVFSKGLSYKLSGLVDVEPVFTGLFSGFCEWVCFHNSLFFRLGNDSCNTATCAFGNDVVDLKAKCNESSVKRETTGNHPRLLWTVWGVDVTVKAVFENLLGYVVFSHGSFYRVSNILDESLHSEFSLKNSVLDQLFLFKDRLKWLEFVSVRFEVVCSCHVIILLNSRKKQSPFSNKNAFSSPYFVNLVSSKDARLIFDSVEAFGLLIEYRCDFLVTNDDGELCFIVIIESLSIEPSIRCNLILLGISKNVTFNASESHQFLIRVNRTIRKLAPEAPQNLGELSGLDVGFESESIHSETTIRSRLLFCKALNEIILNCAHQSALIISAVVTVFHVDTYFRGLSVYGKCLLCKWHLVSKLRIQKTLRHLEVHPKSYIEDAPMKIKKRFTSPPIYPFSDNKCLSVYWGAQT